MRKIWEVMREAHMFGMRCATQWFGVRAIKHQYWGCHWQCADRKGRPALAQITSIAASHEKRESRRTQCALHYAGKRERAVPRGYNTVGQPVILPGWARLTLDASMLHHVHEDVADTRHSLQSSSHNTIHSAAASSNSSLLSPEKLQDWDNGDKIPALEAGDAPDILTTKSRQETELPVIKARELTDFNERGAQCVSGDMDFKGDTRQELNWESSHKNHQQTQGAKEWALVIMASVRHLLRHPSGMCWALAAALCYVRVNSGDQCQMAL
ncbi:hypothetical protein B0H10DRAFT_1961442 [Mycena sp. CBHHK59/15]|nr:hypothetical protein B0H10DRAFT_1961442 [Mycena sp. CBHHK59/15]